MADMELSAALARWKAPPWTTSLEPNSALIARYVTERDQ